MRMKKLLSATLAMLMTLSLAACGSTPNQDTTPSGQNPVENESTGDPIVIKLTTTNASSNPEVQAIVEHCENIKERTNGMVVIDVYADGQMMVYNEGIEAVMSDSAVIYYTACNLFADYVPEFTTVYMPYLYSSTDIAEKFFLSDTWNTIAEKAEAQGIHVISNNFFNGYRHTFANKPVYTASDFEGLTLRIPDSTLYIETFKALNTNFMPMAFSEVYSGMQTGMLDGVEAVAATVASYSLWETTSPTYYSLTKHILDNAGYFVGAGFWESIPEEYRTVIEEELYAAGTDGNAANAAKEAEFIEVIKENGVEVIELEDLSSFQAAVADLVSSQPMGEEVLAEIARIEVASK